MKRKRVCYGSFGAGWGLVLVSTWSCFQKDNKLPIISLLSLKKTVADEAGAILQAKLRRLSPAT
ncbi:hypothetical protein NC653_038936 [Populus alba x Populus x berolinensis]|uniref:Uncharacterized protein n=1 Tax=Populus alba x Populus x berolinensis TaxID=444605 RepID=A0AAD6LA10_9ROSI|nr:hypothetical protein NC653_038936 [Populus alba x Populus x berolinensis]